ncbi:MAG: hypothetical protein KKG99_14415 [Bacteroidetes bacterium]|nr:hypothetical protein [Bacteroidota bacterium]
MIKSLVNILIIVLLIACYPTRQTTGISSSQLNIVINDNKPIIAGKPISIIVKNMYSKSIIIYYPEKLLIEKLEDGDWRKIKILQCPCDAPCQASIDIAELHPGGEIELVWDQMESWCGPKLDEHIRKSIYQRVEKGQYRVRINYKTEGEGDKTSYKSFTLY